MYSLSTRMRMPPAHPYTRKLYIGYQEHKHLGAGNGSSAAGGAGTANMWPRHLGAASVGRSREGGAATCVGGAEKEWRRPARQGAKEAGWLPVMGGSREEGVAAHAVRSRGGTVAYMMRSRARQRRSAQGAKKLGGGSGRRRANREGAVAMNRGQTAQGGE